MKMFKNFFFFSIAALFLAFNWLWDRLDALVWRVISFIPVKTIQVTLTNFMNGLPPYVALLVFIVPYIFIFPIKLLALWLISEDHWLLGMATFFMIKLVGLGLTAFLFDIGREKFLSIGWFNWMYRHIIAFRDWCHLIIDPYKKKVHAISALLSKTFCESILWQRIKAYYKKWQDKMK